MKKTSRFAEALAALDDLNQRSSATEVFPNLLVQVIAQVQIKFVQLDVQSEVATKKDATLLARELSDLLLQLQRTEPKLLGSEFADFCRSWIARVEAVIEALGK